MMTVSEIISYARVKHACPSGKVTHPSREYAEAEADRINERPVRYGPRKRSEPYLCRQCGRWHIGRLRR